MLAEFQTPHKVLGEVDLIDSNQPKEPLCERTNSMNNQRAQPKSSLLASNNPNNAIITSKSVVFESTFFEKSVENALLKSPLNSKTQNKSGSLITPKRKNSSKKYLAIENLENDVVFAYSSGKNSRKNISVVHNQIKDNFENRNLFESHSKNASSALRCLMQDNENDGSCGNAPRKSTKRPANVRYL